MQLTLLIDQEREIVLDTIRIITTADLRFMYITVTDLDIALGDYLEFIFGVKASAGKFKTIANKTQLCINLSKIPAWRLIQDKKGNAEAVLASPKYLRSEGPVNLHSRFNEILGFDDFTKGTNKYFELLDLQVCKQCELKDCNNCPFINN